MSHTHSHSHVDGSQPDIGLRSRIVVLAILALAGIASVVGVVHFWPDSSKTDGLAGSVGFAAPGVTFATATIDQVAKACALSDGTDGQMAGSPVVDGTCGTITATIGDGPDTDRQVQLQVPPDVSKVELGEGDEITVQLTPPTDGQPGVASYYGTERSTPLGVLLVAFVLVVLVVARFRGLMALIGLAFSGAVIALFVLPALLTGESAIPVAVAGSTAIMFVVLFTTHGLSMRTATALVGTLAGVAVSAVVGAWAVGSAHLTGVANEGSTILQSFAGGLDFQGLLVAAIIIAGLGVLNDVTITQASAVWELRAASPDLSRRDAYRSGMRIGRDHIASTIYTIVFAYTGTALTVLLVISLYDRPFLSLIGTEEIAEEVVRALASSIGLVLAVPLTTVIAALTIGAPGQVPNGRRRRMPR